MSLNLSVSNTVYTEGWNRAKAKKLLKIWDEWHLNDMQAGCEHQRKNWDLRKELTIVSFKLNYDILMKQREIETMIDETFKKSKTITLTDEQQEIKNLPYIVELPRGEQYEVPEKVKKYYNPNIKDTNTKMACHFTPTDHPEGLLTKPCEVCGYEYGTSWLKEELPQEVIDFLTNLPKSTKTPAWV